MISPATRQNSNRNGVGQGNADEDLEKGQMCGESESEPVQECGSSSKILPAVTPTSANSLQTGFISTISRNASATEGDACDGKLANSFNSGNKPGQDGKSPPSATAMLSGNEEVVRSIP